MSWLDDEFRRLTGRHFHSHKYELVIDNDTGDYCFKFEAVGRDTGLIYRYEHTVPYRRADTGNYNERAIMSLAARSFRLTKLSIVG